MRAFQDTNIFVHHSPYRAYYHDVPQKLRQVIHQVIKPKVLNILQPTPLSNQTKKMESKPLSNDSCKLKSCKCPSHPS